MPHPERKGVVARHNGYHRHVPQVTHWYVTVDFILIILRSGIISTRKIATITEIRSPETPQLKDAQNFTFTTNPISVPSHPEIIIEAGKSEHHYWRDVWRYRELFYFLAWRDILVRYKQTAIGLAWALVRPLFTIIVFTLIFGRLARLPQREHPIQHWYWSA